MSKPSDKKELLRPMHNPHNEMVFRMQKQATRNRLVLDKYHTNFNKLIKNQNQQFLKDQLERGKFKSLVVKQTGEFKGSRESLQRFQIDH